MTAHMISRTTRLLLLVMIVVASVSFVTPASAAGRRSCRATWFNVIAERGEYVDLDADGVRDDAVTGLFIEVYCPACFTLTDVYCYLVLPSGDAYLFIVTIVGTYRHVHLNVGWYNVITEPGWYRFLVYTEIECGQTTYWSADSLAFDPPTEGNPGPPLAEVLSFTATP